MTPDDIAKHRQSIRDEFVVAHFHLGEWYRKLSQEANWRTLQSKLQFFQSAISSSDLDYRLNCLLWARDVELALNHSLYGVAFSRGYFDAAKIQVPDANNLQVIDFYVRSAAICLISARDKLACFVWSYFYPFDPDDKKKIPGFDDVYGWLRQPLTPRNRSQYWSPDIKILEAALPFSNALHDLANGSHLKRIKELRDVSVHRRESKIDLGRPSEHEEFRAVLPIASEQQKAEFEAELQKVYHNADPAHFAFLLQRQKIDGIPFRQTYLKSHKFTFEEIGPLLTSALAEITVATARCIDELAKLPPFDEAYV